MNRKLKTALQRVGYPAYVIYRRLKLAYGLRHPKWWADRLFYECFGRHINWENPQDLNEKINWLKFHADPHEWARLADKYAVREYVAERGLADILVPLYGKWDTSQAVLDAWGSLPDEFVLKSNTSSGRLLIVSTENGGKGAVDLATLKNTLEGWLAEKDCGLEYAELHYQFIPNCVIAEKLLSDDSVKEFSRSPIDYKIWCFDGKPYGCHIAYDRDISAGRNAMIFYDLDYKAHLELMADSYPRHSIFKPESWERMLEVAATLSKGHPQARVDLYSIGGKIYFGEMTMTSCGGYMNWYTPDFLLEMGRQIHLDLSMPENEFAARG